MRRGPARRAKRTGLAGRDARHVPIHSPIPDLPERASHRNRMRPRSQIDSALRGLTPRWPWCLLRRPSRRGALFAALRARGFRPFFRGTRRITLLRLPDIRNVLLLSASLLVGLLAAEAGLRLVGVSYPEFQPPRRPAGMGAPARRRGLGGPSRATPTSATTGRAFATATTPSPSRRAPFASPSSAIRSPRRARSPSTTPSGRSPAAAWRTVPASPAPRSRC